MQFTLQKNVENSMDSKENKRGGFKSGLHTKKPYQKNKNPTIKVHWAYNVKRRFRTFGDYR